MLTYLLEKESGESLYEQLYRRIRRDILHGALREGEKLPSKRALAEHLRVSVITVENAYEQLAAEGYVYARERRGYYVSAVETPAASAAEEVKPVETAAAEWKLDLVTNTPAAESFPFATWARLMRRVLLDRGTDLLRPTNGVGVWELRCAIAAYLRSFRGMSVHPEQIVVGAGTELLYLLLIQLLGRDKVYAVEDPGYGKIGRIYAENGVAVRHVALDHSGVSVSALRQSGADVVHLSPGHHFPTGLVTPVTRRQELLRWASEREGRWILEDDYDSEFRFVGRPIPTLFSASGGERVIYMNTFSKTIAPSIRISYMILPVRLMEAYRRRLGFYACTVPAFEQYTLASFLSEGYYERHLRSMKTRYHRKRDTVIESIRSVLPDARIREEDAGLHFLAQVHTSLTDGELRRRAGEAGIRLALLSEYYSVPSDAPQHVLVINYSGIDTAHLAEGLQVLRAILEPSERG